MLPFSCRCWLVCCLGLFLISPGLFAAESSYGVAAYTLIDNQTGHVLESFQGEKKRQVASLTKICTAMVALDWSASASKDLGQLTVVPNDIGKIGGANPIGLAPGDFISIRDLIYCTLLQSDNIAAYALARHVGRSIQSMSTDASDLDAEGIFITQMNALARKLGMEHTLFLNANGLEPARGKLPFSTSGDMAALTRYAMADKGFRFYVSQSERKVTVIRNMQPIQYLLKNTNEMLGQQGVDGVKTGRTARAGDCLILSSAREPETRQENGKFYATPRRVSVILLGAADRFNAGRQLLDRAWQLEQNWISSGRPGASQQ